MQLAHVEDMNGKSRAVFNSGWRLMFALSWFPLSRRFGGVHRMAHSADGYVAQCIVSAQMVVSGGS
jgi:hypothetical protein